MDRRKFLGWVGLGAVATSMPIALAACSSPESTSSDVDPAGDPSATSVDPATAGFVAVGAVSALEGGGSITQADFPGSKGDLVVLQAGDQVIALDSYCNHQGCSSAWDGTELVCPCHNSKFGPDGSLISGPATEGLKTLEAKIEGDQVLVKSA